MDNRTKKPKNNAAAGYKAPVKIELFKGAGQVTINSSLQYNNNIAGVNVPPQNVKISLVGNLLRQEIFSYKTQSVNFINSFQVSLL